MPDMPMISCGSSISLSLSWIRSWNFGIIFWHARLKSGFFRFFSWWGGGLYYTIEILSNSGHANDFMRFLPFLFLILAMHLRSLANNLACFSGFRVAKYKIWLRS